MFLKKSFKKIKAHVNFFLITFLLIAIIIIYPCKPATSDSFERQVQLFYDCLKNIELHQSCPYALFDFMNRQDQTMQKKYSAFLQQFLYQRYFKDRCSPTIKELNPTTDFLCEQALTALSNVHHIAHSDAKTITPLNPATGKPLFLETGKSAEAIKKYIITKAGDILSCSQKNSIILWEKERNYWPLLLYQTQSPVTALEYLDYNTVFIGKHNGMATIISLEPYTNKKKSSYNQGENFKEEISWIKHTKAITGALKTKMGNILTASLDGTLKLWCPSTGEELITRKIDPLGIIALIPVTTKKCLTLSIHHEARLWKVEDKISPSPLLIDNILHLILLLKLESARELTDKNDNRQDIKENNKQDLKEAQRKNDLAHQTNTQPEDQIIKLSDDWSAIFQTLPPAMKALYAPLIDLT